MKVLRRLGILVSVLQLAGGAMLAAQSEVELKNGDRITAALTRSDGKTLTVTSPTLGDVAVPWGAIVRIVSDKTVFVVLPDKSTVRGALTTEGSDLVVATAAGPVRVPLASNPVLRSEAEQAAFERSEHPGLFEGIVGAVGLGLTLARGNSEATNWSLAVTLVRLSPRDRFALSYTSVYASDATGTTANDMRGSARYDRNVSQHAFGFISADYERNELQFLDLRQVYTLGLGIHALRGTPTRLDFLAGANYTMESYNPTPTNNMVGATIGEDLTHRFGTSSVLTEQLLVYPDLQDLGEFRAAFDVRFATKLKSWLSWLTTVSDRYTSTPQLGTEKNDLIFTTGLNITFTH
jgi:hypothetical protein